MREKHTFVERCLQIVSATYYSLYFVFIIAYFTLLPYLIYNHWQVFLLLSLWVWYDRETPRKGGRPSRLFSNNIMMRHFRNYFPMELVKTADLDPNKNYLFCSHPHGYLCVAVFGNLFCKTSPFEEYFPWHSFRTASIDIGFIFPVMREFVMGHGLISATEESMAYLLNDKKKGNIVNLMVGGAAEVYYGAPGEYKIVLNRRKGFVRLALKEGCSLVPVFHFGENDVFEIVDYKKWSWLHRYEQFLKRITGVCWLVPYGRWWFFPKRVPITTVVGKPIQLPKIADPTQEEIDNYHALYIKELNQLFNEHKFKYVKDPENTHLIIVE